VTSTIRTRGAVLSAVTALTVTLSACTSESTSDGASSSAPTGAGSPTSATVDAPAADRPFGPACGAIPAEGPGSFAGMSTQPVAAAAGTNPALSSLVQAATTANLVDSLNSQRDVTVLAPVNSAFQALPPDRLTAIQGDVPQLTALLTHHVLTGRLAPADLAGTRTTANNDTVFLEAGQQTLTIPGDQTLTGQPATVLCGNIQTANATVYIIDQVLAFQPAG